MTSVYFEPQRSKDCVIHSLNNAMGGRVISKDEVMAFIRSQAARIAAERGSVEAERYARSMSTGTTFFTAEVVWQAAESLGRIRKPAPIPGFSGAFAIVSSLPEWIRTGSNIVLLGLEIEGNHHAIAVHDGMLLDSLHHKKGPVEFNDRELSKRMSNVFAAYLVSVPDPSPPTRVVRTQPMTLK
jgi:hypothetical protein